jgi:molybdenum cofactor cytidylyltransferase
MDDVECLIPAAGCSQRMGEWKPTLPFGGSTIVETVVRTALAVCPRVILVAGYRGEALSALFRGEPRVTLVPNQAWELGMFCSVRAGAAHVRAGNFFICPADMPFITAECYRALLAAAPAEVVVPVFSGRRGHPVLLAGALLPAILQADPATGSMRQLISARAVKEIAWADASIHRDIDTREDYTEIPRAPGAR